MLGYSAKWHGSNEYLVTITISERLSHLKDNNDCVFETLHRQLEVTMQIVVLQRSILVISNGVWITILFFKNI